MTKLVKIDRNGSKHYEGHIECDRCQGRGEYWWGAMISYGGGSQMRPQFSGVCYKCGGAGKVMGKWIERTPEYQAKLDAKREAKWAAVQAKREAERAEREAQAEARRVEREKKIAEQKAISQYVGEVGGKVEMKVSYVHTAGYEQRCYSGFGTEWVYIHIFKDETGNVITWRTTSKGDLGVEQGTQVVIKATIKAHTEYRDEKQTQVIRLKVQEAA